MVCRQQDLFNICAVASRFIFWGICDVRFGARATSAYLAGMTEKKNPANAGRVRFSVRDGIGLCAWFRLHPAIPFVAAFAATGFWDAGDRRGAAARRVGIVIIAPDGFAAHDTANFGAGQGFVF